MLFIHPPQKEEMEIQISSRLLFLAERHYNALPATEYPKPFVCYYYANKLRESRHQATEDRNGSNFRLEWREGEMEDERHKMRKMPKRQVDNEDSL
jgi:hypothetical protein